MKTEQARDKPGTEAKRYSKLKPGSNKDVLEADAILRVVVIDDDLAFNTVLSKWGELEGVQVDTYSSLSDLGFIGLLENYDIAVVDYDLGRMHGTEIADAMDKLLKGMPMLLISSSDRTGELSKLPGCVKAFIKKSEGYSHIIDAARKFTSARRMSRS